MSEESSPSRRRPESPLSDDVADPMDNLESLGTDKSRVLDDGMVTTPHRGNEVSVPRKDGIQQSNEAEEETEDIEHPLVNDKMKTGAHVYPTGPVHIEQV